MPEAAFVPRVLILVVCDEVVSDELEAGVFNLIGVRQQHTVEFFPWAGRMTLFLLLSSARRGTFRGTALVRHLDRNIRAASVEFDVEFPGDNLVLPLWVNLEGCEFPEAGRYVVEIFFARGTRGADVLKGEQLFDVLQLQE
jgi:hypothetical protein